MDVMAWKKTWFCQTLVASCCIFWQGCCNIYSVRQAWLNVSINEDLLDTILFCRTNCVCPRGSFSKTHLYENHSTKNLPKLQHGNGEEPLQAPGKIALCGSIRWIKNIHPTKTLQKGKNWKTRGKPHYHPTSLVFKTTAPKKRYPRNSMHCNRVDRMKRSLDSFWLWS